MMRLCRSDRLCHRHRCCATRRARGLAMRAVVAWRAAADEMEAEGARTRGGTALIRLFGGALTAVQRPTGDIGEIVRVSRESLLAAIEAQQAFRTLLLHEKAIVGPRGR